MSKPGSAYSVAEISEALVDKIHAAAVAKIGAPSKPRTDSTPAKQHASTLVYTSHKIIAIGASTGGTRAIEEVLSGLPANSPGTLIVQHMPEHFTTGFAQRLGEICPMEVREARNSDLVTPGVALIAPGNYHMLLRRSGARYSAVVKTGPQVHHQRPSVDVLFHSVAKHAGPNAVGVILTGMGSDGAKGLLAMHEAGAPTLAQDEASCVVFGMPREAIALGAAEHVVPLNRMSARIIEMVSRPTAAVPC